VDEGFFERPILNSPYAYPDRHWELDDDGQPTNQILPKRRDSKLLTPVPKPQKRRRTTNQPGFRIQPDSDHQRGPALCRRLAQPAQPDQWQVTPETARLLRH
jgi:type III restriction enzyme